ncbi:MAG TPA: hypothetical protein VIK86_01120 [Candidatus Paceibacterota bacterium]
MNNKNFLAKITSTSESYWNNLLVEKKFEVFHETYLKSSAYKKFLKIQKWHKKTLTDANFQKLPTMTKDNYLKKFPMEELVLKDSLYQPLVLTSTSGSTGEPFYFPRTKVVDEQYSYIIERFIKEGGDTKNEPTLVLICFGMGVWIGGLITYQAFETAGIRNNLPISILTPGVNKVEIIKALRLIAPNYKNIIMAGYPPFIKDCIDEAKIEKIDFSKYTMRFIFAAEVFTENFRDYICHKTKVKNIYRDTLSIYGSADIGAMAWETGVLILLKRLLLKKEGQLESFFGAKHTMPTICYFNPSWLQFESKDGEVLISGKNAIPFVRYGIGDHGGTFTFSDIKERLNKLNIDFDLEIKNAGLSDAIIKLPCVYVYERKDLSTTLYGLQIYPEVIRESLIHDILQSYFTTKFSMSTKFNNKQDQYLEIVIEIKKGIKVIPKEIKYLALKNIVENLHKSSSEFAELKKHIGNRAHPKLIFTHYEDKKYFKPGIKQKWVRKS